MSSFIERNYVWSPALFLALVFFCKTSIAAPEFTTIDLDTAQNGQHESLSTPPQAEEQETIAPRISPVEAANLVRRKTGGQVMGVTTLRQNGGVTYGVKVLNSGRMKVINVDGQTGQLLNN